MSERAELLNTFLYQSVADIQGTIRQLDLKANAILVFLTLLLTVTNHIGGAVHCVLNSRLEYLGYLFAVAIPVLWLLSVYCCYRILNSVFNPSSKIQATHSHPTGTFFGAGQFKLNLFLVLFGRAIPKARPSLTAFVHRLPSDEEAIHQELAFEQLKLFYIRDVKAIRLRVAFGTAFLCLVLCAAVWVLAAPWTATVTPDV